LANISYRVGNQPLQIDTKTERITNNSQADKLLKPAYRPPYVIPDVV
jgi:hypothetical protein